MNMKTCYWSLQKDTEIHWSPSSLVAMIIELEFSLETENKSRMDITIDATEMKSCANEDFIDLQQVMESQENDWDVYDNRVFWMRKRVDESLQQTFNNVYGAFDQLDDQVETLFTNIIVPRLQLDPFKVVRDGDLVEDLDAASQGGEASLFYIIMSIGCCAQVFPY